MKHKIEEHNLRLIQKYLIEYSKSEVTEDRLDHYHKCPVCHRETHSVNCELGRVIQMLEHIL